MSGEYSYWKNSFSSFPFPSLRPPSLPSPFLPIPFLPFFSVLVPFSSLLFSSISFVNVLYPLLHILFCPSLWRYLLLPFKPPSYSPYMHEFLSIFSFSSHLSVRKSCTSLNRVLNENKHTAGWAVHIPVRLHITPTCCIFILKREKK